MNVLCENDNEKYPTTHYTETTFLHSVLWKIVFLILPFPSLECPMSVTFEVVLSLSFLEQKAPFTS